MLTRSRGALAPPLALAGRSAARAGAAAAPPPPAWGRFLPTRARGALALILALLVLSVASPAAAQKQTVVIYTAIENEQITEYKKAYEKALPNLDVKMLRLSTGDVAARFMAEKDNMQADLIWGVGATNMLQVKNAGPP